MRQSCGAETTWTVYITEPSSVLCINFRILAGGVWRSVIVQSPKTSLRNGWNPLKFLSFQNSKSQAAMLACK